MPSPQHADQDRSVRTDIVFAATSFYTKTAWRVLTHPHSPYSLRIKTTAVIEPGLRNGQAQAQFFASFPDNNFLK